MGYVCPQSGLFVFTGRTQYWSAFPFPLFFRRPVPTAGKTSTTTRSTFFRMDTAPSFLPPFRAGPNHSSLVMKVQSRHRGGKHIFNKDCAWLQSIWHEMAALEKIKCIAGGERSCQFSLEAANHFFSRKPKQRHRLNLHVKMACEQIKCFLLETAVLVSLPIALLSLWVSLFILLCGYIFSVHVVCVGSTIGTKPPHLLLGSDWCFGAHSSRRALKCDTSNPTRARCPRPVPTTGRLTVGWSEYRRN